MDNQENNQTFIEKIDADILKELESIEDTYRFFSKGNDKYNYRQQHGLVWSRNNQREALFKKFVNDFKEYNTKEINDLMMEILESGNINEIKDKSMIIYNIILSGNLNKELNFKIEKVDNELIEDNKRRAKNRQWYKDKINILFKLIEYTFIIIICFSPFAFIFHCLYNILLISGINLIMGFIGAVITAWLLFIFQNFIEE